MPLTPSERKRLLRHGDQRTIAARTGRSGAHVHYVLSGVRRDARVEAAFCQLVRRAHADCFTARRTTTTTTPRKGT
jgi:hypothetical protein